MLAPHGHPGTSAKCRYWGVKRTTFLNVSSSHFDQSGRSRADGRCASNPDYFSDVNFQRRDIQGRAETFHYLGTPIWLIRVVLKLIDIISTRASSSAV
jgi:hypothetical protein